MKFSLSATTIFSAILLASFTTAAPVVPSERSLGRAKNAPAAVYCKFLNSFSRNSLIYSRTIVMTNEPTGNFVVSANIGQDGKLVGIAPFNWAARD